MDTKTNTPRIYAALAAVMGDLAKEGIAKGRKNDQGATFFFRGIDDVMNALSPILSARGVVVVPAYTTRTETQRTTSKGGTLFCVVVEGTFTLACVEDGSSVTVGPFFGEAFDSGDKATNKAMSIALKYGMLQTFMVPTESTPDPDADTHTIKNIWEELNGSFNACITIDDVTALRKSQWPSVKNLDGAAEKFNAMSRSALARIKAAEDAAVAEAKKDEREDDAVSGRNK